MTNMYQTRYVNKYFYTLCFPLASFSTSSSFKVLDEVPLLKELEPSYMSESLSFPISNRFGCDFASICDRINLKIRTHTYNFLNKLSYISITS